MQTMIKIYRHNWVSRLERKAENYVKAQQNFKWLWDTFQYRGTKFHKPIGREFLRVCGVAIIQVYITIQSN